MESSKVEQCFALSATAFIIRYKDDDGEITDVTSDGDLTEAIHYFHTGDDIPLSSNSSILSNRSGGGRKVTLRLSIIVENELSLSDTASMISVDEYTPDTIDPLSGRGLSLDGNSHQLEDDAVTVSSRDAGSYKFANLRPLSPVPSGGSYSSSPLARSSASMDQNRSGRSSSRNEPSSGEGSQTLHPTSNHVSPTNVFDRLKQLELNDGEQGEGKRLSQTSLGAQWLRDQNVRTIMFGDLTEPSISDESEDVPVQDYAGDLNGDLALQQDEHGKYYYEYTSSGASHAAPEDTDIASTAESSLGEMASHQGEPSLHSLSWIAEQRANAKAKANATSKPPIPVRGPVPNPFVDMDISSHMDIDPDIPPEVLEFIPEHRFPLLPPEQITNCSSCNVVLDSFRYVCTTCGELEPHPRDDHGSSNGTSKGKGRDVPHIHIQRSQDQGMTYPPSRLSNTSSPASSSWTLLDTVPQRKESLVDRPLPALPNGNVYPRSVYHSRSQDTLFIPPSDTRRKPSGYELCTSCIEIVGVLHSLEGGTGSSPLSNSPLSSSQESLQTLSQLRRTAPRSKGDIRHAYREKVWGRNGWKDVGM